MKNPLPHATCKLRYQLKSITSKVHDKLRSVSLYPDDEMGIYLRVNTTADGIQLYHIICQLSKSSDQSHE